MQIERETQDWRMVRSQNGVVIVSAIVQGKVCHFQEEARDIYRNEMIFWKNRGWKVELVELHELFGNYGGDIIQDGRDQ